MKNNYSPTSLQILHRCSRQWVLSEVKYLQPTEKSPYLESGTLVHAALERIYRGQPWQEPFDQATRTLLASDASGGILEKRLTIGRQLLMEYPDFYRGEFIVPLAVECPVKVPLPGVPDAFITGKIDLIARNCSNGHLLVMDHKTASDFSSYEDESMARDLQFATYSWLASVLWPFEQVDFAVNVLRMKEVKDPVITTTGQVSRDRQVATTPRRVRETLRARGVDPAGFQSYLQQLKSESQFFRRCAVAVTRKANDIVPTLQRTVWLARQVEEGRMGPVGVAHADQSCKWGCDFHDVCFLMEATGLQDLDRYKTMLAPSTWYTSGSKDYTTPDTAADRLREWTANPLPGLGTL